MKENHKHKRTRLSKRCSELYRIKDQQKQLRQRERELKSEMMKAMYDTQILEDAEGKIEKISRKPKRIYDKELLAAELKKHGLTNDINAIIDGSTRKIEVSEYLSVTSKRKEG